MVSKLVVHITAHMGGGVGKVLSGIAVYDKRRQARYQHIIVLLEQPQKMNFPDSCLAAGVEVVVAPAADELIALIKRADIVQLEWWHHPLMADLLAKFPRIPVRAIIWSHVSGCYYPYLPPELIQTPQGFIFTSEYSYDNPYWSYTDRNRIKSEANLVNSSGGFDGIDGGRIVHEGFNIGYVGTQSYVKLNERTLYYYRQVIDIPDVRFTFVGDTVNKETLFAEAEKLGFAARLNFIGYTDDVARELAGMDIFAYLLAPTHFGTTENALLEAMAAGLPVIVLSQCAEQYLVRHGETGLCVSTEEDFGEAVRYLYNNPDVREHLGRQARTYVIEEFSAARTSDRLAEIYDSIMLLDPKLMDFAGVVGSQPYEYFLNFLPPHLKLLFYANKDKGEALHEIPLILKEQGKSSLPHFHRSYPDDYWIARWTEEAAGITGNNL